MQENKREKSSIKQRVLQFIDKKRITKYQFYKETGITRGVLDQDSGMSEENTARFIAYYPEVNIEWLVTGNGDMLKSAEKSVSKSVSKSVPNDKNEEKIEEKRNDTNRLNDDEHEVSLHSLKTDYYGVDKQLIPLYELEATAGLNVLFSNQNTQVPLDFITIPNAPKCDGALFIRGDSMYPILKAGDIVCYKTIQDIMNVRFGEIYLLDIDDGDDQYLTVKYVQKSDKGDKYFRLVSHNTHHDPKDEDVSHIRALALVKVSIRYNTIS
ncbi:S24 family peptidase [Dysgonomonas sp. 520]|uniref:S24 family peptidase n=1 Tax=Dysgonomonas sp. 520 TaxID=2302931 RepID=UPI0013D46C20|nr:S24 family peptidase [Dysgonomonas sp. 520]NDW10923.1 S24 family peptidase [Dysgonomonas sp. 520]